jgi:hypothetical protein
MNLVNAFGIVASIIAVFELGYFIGKSRGRKERDALMVDKFNQVISSLSISNVELRPNSVSPTQTITLSYTIVNRADFAIEVWLGATIIDSSEGQYWDGSQDKVVNIEPGERIYERYLTISPGAPLGRYLVIGQIWIGTMSNPAQSIQITHFERDDLFVQ